MLFLATLLLPLLSSTLATPEILNRNLAYLSPYANDPSLSIDTTELHKRHVKASRAIKRELSKRADPPQTYKPHGFPSTYTLSGYGGQVVHWDDATYIYAGGLNFTHSVGSGDPYDYSVILWTRAVPTQEYRVDVPMCVQYKVYTGANATGNVVSQGYALTNADIDFTVKVEALGLSASTAYTYQFSNCAQPNQLSPVGKTKTAPGAKATNVATQRFAVYSCSNYPNGFFSAYSGPVVHQDVDYVVHVGDYIYEGGTGGASIGRNQSGNKECATLADYRARYAQYHADIDTLQSHQNFPWIAIWDDHETANNDWKAGSQDSNDSIATGGCSYANSGVCWTERAANAKRAYHEWIPIRQVDVSDEARIWREFNFGDLLDVFALDTRKYDRDITDLSANVPNTEYVHQLAVDLNSSRSITGPKQEKWILDRLQASQDRKTTWRMILNQVIFGSINYTMSAVNPNTPGVFSLNYDSWDGYQAERQRIMQYVYDHDITNTATFTGDTHAFWLFENNLQNVLQGTIDQKSLTPLNNTSNGYKRGQMVEYGGTAVSSSGWGNSWGSYENSTTGAKGLVASNAGLLYSEGYYRGYMSVDVSYDNITTSYYGYPGNQQARVINNRTLGARFVQKAGMNQVQRPLPTPNWGAIKAGN